MIRLFKMREIVHYFKLAILCKYAKIFEDSSNGLLLSFLFCVIAYGQTDSLHPRDINGGSCQDDEFNVFLFTVFALFMCGLFGAAFIGALAAALLLGLVFILLTFGLLSTATAVGLYKRSFKAGFSSLLILIFGIGCSIIGVIGFLLVHMFFDLSVNRATIALIGLVSGSLAGVVLGKVSAKVIKLFFAVCSTN